MVGAGVTTLCVVVSAVETIFCVVCAGTRALWSTVEAGVGVCLAVVMCVGELFILISVGLSPPSSTLPPRCRTSFSWVLAIGIKTCITVQ